MFNKIIGSQMCESSFESFYDLETWGSGMYGRATSTQV